MNSADFFEVPQRWLQLIVRRLLTLWVRVQVFPQPLRIDAAAPVCYVLPRPSVTNSAMLDELTRSHDVPKSHAPLNAPQSADARQERHAFFALLEDRSGVSAKRLTRLVDAVMEGRTPDVQLVPVSIFWGRAPEREEREGSPLRGLRWLRLWAAEGWGGRSRLKKIFAIVFFRRSVVAKFGEAVSLAELIRTAEIEGLDRERIVRRAARLLRTEFRTEREAAIGPDLSHRRTLIESMMREPRVREAILREVDDKKTTLVKVESRADAIGREIAADYSYIVVRVLETMLGRLWNRIYGGVELRGVERLQALAKDNTLVYVPCHRSHIDYLLLSYVVHKIGLTVPHIAAGANLNLPIVGGILRRGGAFFLRRSFKNDELYGEVFAAYVHAVLKRGFPMEYFVEGGRSRTGRLLPPKAGLISMTVQSYLREHSRPLLFIPVYIGYEKLFEGGSYTEELGGAAKKKESIFGLIGAIWALRRERFGTVGVSFARPISLGELLDAEGAKDMDDWLADKSLRRRALTEVSRQIAERINAAVHLNPVAVVATALLATPKHAADAAQLASIVERLLRLVAHSGATPDAVPTTLTGTEAIAYTARMGYLTRKSHPLGDVVLAEPTAAVALTYFRNNVLHCFALPGLLACLIVQYGVIGKTKLARLARELYVLLESELYLPPWREADAGPQFDFAVDEPLADLGPVTPTFAAFERTLETLGTDHWVTIEVEANVISTSAQGTDAAMHLEVLASTIRPTLTRHALMLALVVRGESGEKSRESLETLCQQAAQHLAMTHVFNAPEFSDRTQFRSAFDALLRAGLVKLDSADCVHFEPALQARAEDAAFLLPPDTRAAVLRAAGHGASASQRQHTRVS
jgi:glycerol-3-phosphate O-acyltransferase